MNIIYKDTKRNEVSKEGMYIFTDNTDRSSGRNLIGDWNWYGKKYGKMKCYPHSTTSQLRGLENAYPITLQKHCFSKGSYKGGQWLDEEFDEFKKYIDEDIAKIKEDLPKYKYIVLPEGGLFGRPISEITQERTPRLFMYLLKQLINL